MALHPNGPVPMCNMAIVFSGQAGRRKPFQCFKKQSDSTLWLASSFIGLGREYAPTSRFEEAVSAYKRALLRGS